MIWQLAREQLRSQRRYVVWTAAMLTAGIALATYASVTGSTQVANELSAQRIAGADKPFHGGVSSDPSRPTFVPPVAERGANADTSWASLNEVDAAVADAIAAGSDVRAHRPTALFLTNVMEDDYYRSRVELTVGDIDWDQILVEGRPPASGEVAISGWVAQTLDASIGDTVPAQGDQALRNGDASLVGPSAELRVSGITRTPARGRNYEVDLPEAYGAWEDSAELLSAGALGAGTADELLGAYTDAVWSERDAALSVFGDSYTPYYGANWGSSNSVGITLAIAGALAAGLVVMALAVGRSQAQQRVKWVATVRALGVKRDTVAAATALESAVVGLVSAAAGIAVGWLAVGADMAWVRSQAPDAFLPSAPVFPGWLLTVLVLFALLLSGFVIAVPALWAARTEPVEGLKPTGRLVEQPRINRVHTARIVLAWIASVTALGAIQLGPFDFENRDWVATGLTLVAIVLGFMLVRVWLIWAIARLGRRLSASRRPWAISAGDSLAAHPRQEASSALLWALVLVPAAFVTTLLWVRDGVQQARAMSSSGEVLADRSTIGYWTAAMAFVIVALLVAILISLAIFSSYSRAAQADDATRSALGLTRADARRSRAVQFSLPLVTGAAVAVVVGAVLALVASLVADLTGEALTSVAEMASGVASAAQGLTLLSVTTLFFVGLGTAIAAGTTSRRTPVRELAHA